MKQLTAALISAVGSDLWPSPATCVDFGLDSPEHFGALQFEIRRGRVTTEELDAACGNGPALSLIVKRHGDNPYGDAVTFVTSWDDLEEEDDYEEEIAIALGPVAECRQPNHHGRPCGQLYADQEALERHHRREHRLCADAACGHERRSHNVTKHPFDGACAVYCCPCGKFDEGATPPRFHPPVPVAESDPDEVPF